MRDGRDGPKERPTRLGEYGSACGVSEAMLGMSPPALHWGPFRGTQAMTAAGAAPGAWFPHLWRRPNARRVS